MQTSLSFQTRENRLTACTTHSLAASGSLLHCNVTNLILADKTYSRGVVGPKDPTLVRYQARIGIRGGRPALLQIDSMRALSAEVTKGGGKEI